MSARFIPILVFVTVQLTAGAAFAADPTPTAVLRLELGTGVSADIGESVGSQVRRAAQDSPLYAVAPDVSIGLNDVAALLGCSASTPSCLRQIAAEVGVTTLVYGELREHEDQTLQLELNIWDAERGLLNRTSRTVAADPDPVTALRPAIDELFFDGAAPASAEPARRPRGPNWGGWSALTVGSLCVGASVATGIALAGTVRRLEDDAAAGMLTEDRYRQLEERGENLELAHRVLLGVGLVGVAVGATWLIVDAASDRKARVMISPAGAQIQWTW